MGEVANFEMKPEARGTSGWVQSCRLGTANYYAENRE